MGRICPMNYGDSPSSSSEEGEWQRTLDTDGIPIFCYCGKLVVLKTQTVGLQRGRRLYTYDEREDGECHIYKMWDDAIVEEIRMLKEQVRETGDRMREWIGSPDHMSLETLWELLSSSEKEKKKLKELVTKHELSDKETNTVKEMVKELEAKLGAKIAETNAFVFYAIAETKEDVKGTSARVVYAGVIVVVALLSFFYYFF